MLKMKSLFFLVLCTYIVAVTRAQFEPVIPILEDVRDGPHADGSYYFRYATGNGIFREEQSVPTGPDTYAVTGSYTYTAPNGEVIEMQYIADENGYRAFPSNRGGLPLVTPVRPAPAQRPSARPQRPQRPVQRPQRPGRPLNPRPVRPQQNQDFNYRDQNNFGGQLENSFNPQNAFGSRQSPTRNQLRPTGPQRLRKPSQNFPGGPQRSSNPNQKFQTRPQRPVNPNQLFANQQQNFQSLQSQNFDSSFAASSLQGTRSPGQYYENPRY